MVVARPKRDPERIRWMCEGAVALAKLADSRPMPGALRNSLNQLPSAGPEVGEVAVLARVLERARRAPRVVPLGNREFLNYLVGGYRPGLDATGLDAERLQAHVEREHRRRFANEDNESAAGFPSRRSQLDKAAAEIRGPGLYLTFNHWTDLALEVWGDLIDSSNDFRIGLMIVAKDAYPFVKTLNVGLHRYDDEIATWQNLWMEFLEIPEDVQYRDIAGHTAGVFDAAKPLGDLMRRFQVWPTNAIAYFRNWESASGHIPKAALGDKWSICLLAFQLWLLRPRHILALGAQTPEVVEAALRVVASDQGERPEVICTNHSAYRYQNHQDANKLSGLRKRLLDSAEYSTHHGA